MPGQVGLNAGILPSPGFTYVNMDINYDAGTYNDFRESYSGSAAADSDKMDPHEDLVVSGLFGWSGAPALKGSGGVQADAQEGYDQWQVTANSGTVSVGNQILPASSIPFYSVHAVGGELNFILPAKNFSLIQVRTRIQVLLSHGRELSIDSTSCDLPQLF